MAGFKSFIAKEVITGLAKSQSWPWWNLSPTQSYWRNEAIRIACRIDVFRFAYQFGHFWQIRKKHIECASKTFSDPNKTQNKCTYSGVICFLKRSKQYAEITKSLKSMNTASNFDAYPTKIDENLRFEHVRITYTGTTHNQNMFLSGPSILNAFSRAIKGHVKMTFFSPLQYF